MRDKITLIKDLSNAFGPSGFEDDVVSIVKEELKDFNNIEEDTLRNVRVSHPLNTNNRKRIMLDAHTDEVGYIIQGIMPNGMLKFLPIGGIALSTMPSSKVKIKNLDGELISGIISQKPVHFMSKDERNSTGDVSSMSIDIGATSDKEVKEVFKIAIGNPVIMDVTCSLNEKNNVFLGKAFDDRIGVALQIEVMRRLKEEHLDVDLFASFSSQEEVGERGIKANVLKIKPDVCICFEGTPCDDTFNTSFQVQTKMKEGPMLRHFDICMITNPRFMRFSLNEASKNGVKYQEAVRSGGGTNGGLIHTYDVPTIVIGVPVRYIHSNYCYCALEDFNSSVDFALSVIKALNSDIINNF
ncbi:MAG: M20/M25/M40 family metallo-hydrolase [Bacilli bacterium]|nr:M20/M25/M40 family metallo-hydrolase [Bacilli bacterium]